MKVSHYIAAHLHAQGVTHVFELVGGMITHLLDAIGVQGTIRVVSVHHEQAAAFAAEATGRMRGVPGVAMATSGPGATNLLTGIGSCYFDSSPAVYITGQVNRNEQKGDRAIRQLGFQETDIVTMAAPLTKWATSVRSPEDVPTVMDQAFRVALSGRPGPVLVDIPMDVQRAEIDAPPPSRITVEPKAEVNSSFVAEVLDALHEAERPLILAGGGIRSARAVDEFRRFVETAGVPVVHSLMGVDALPFSHPLRVGMIGSYGNRWANHSLDRADLLLVIGSRLDVRQTGSQTEAFRKGREIYHVDCEPGEMNNRVTGCHTMQSELRPFLEHARVKVGRPLPDRTAWAAEIVTARRAWPDIDEIRSVPGINPNAFMHELSRRSAAASAFVVDVGQHQMWAAQSIELSAAQRFLTSGGMGAMGFALPAAIGASCADPGRPIVQIAGDGGFQLNIQELQTIVHNKLPIKIVVLNNLCHGMVRQFQQSYFEERYQSTYWGYSAPDFTAIARAYGIDARVIRHPAEIPASLDALWADPAAPMLLEVRIDTFANAYPKLAFGHPISQMEPFAQPLDMEGT